MRILSFLSNGLLLLMCLPCAELYGRQHITKQPDLQDPVFGLTYNYKTIHYDALPMSVRHICPDLEKGTYWTIAHVRIQSGDYYISTGVASDQDGDSLGFALWVHGSQCEGYDSTRMLSGFVPASGYQGSVAESGGLPGKDAPEICTPPTGVPDECHYILRSAEEEAILRGLVKDAILRAARAWGGEASFKQQACKPSILQQDAPYPIIEQEMTNFCSARAAEAK